MSSEYNFILHEETLVFGAISNDILRRAIGVSNYRKTRLFLVNCSEQFVDHARDYTAPYLVNIHTVNTIEQVHEYLLKKDISEQILVTHTWPSTLYAIVPKFKEWNLVLIDEALPLCDRLPSYIGNRRYIDRILSTKIALRTITHRYRKTVMSAKMYIAISEYERMVLEKYYGLHADAAIYAPVDDRYFFFSESDRKSIIVFGNPNKDAINCVINSIAPRNIEEIILVNSDLSLSEDFIPGINTTHIQHYTFKELQSLYGKAVVSITDESRGLFELIPIESIMSGVPIISPVVPSLQILKDKMDSRFSRSGNITYPYFDYFRLLTNNCNKNPQLNDWFSKADQMREHFSKMCQEIFSIDNVGMNFISKIEKRLSYTSKK